MFLLFLDEFYLLEMLFTVNSGMKIRKIHAFFDDFTLDIDGQYVKVEII